MDTTPAERLRKARQQLFETATDAARAHGWPVSTYLAHENGQNQLRPETARKYAKAFKVSWTWLLSDEGEQHVERQSIPIMGRVGAGGDVEPDIEQVDPVEGIDTIELPATAVVASSMIGDPVGFEVRGDSMYPRYKDGDVLIVEREQPWATESMIGDEAVVVIHDEDGSGRRMVKRIMPGPKRHTFNLESLDPNVPTLEAARIRWASPVRVIIPSVGLRRMTPKRKRPSAPRPAAPRKR